MPVNFDVDGARKAGYSDQEIADEIARSAGFDAEGARKAGYGDQHIIEFLSKPSAPARSDPNAGAKKVATDTGTVEAVLVGAGRTFDRIGKGMKQAYYGMTGNEKELTNLKRQAEADDAVYKPLQEARPVTTLIGEALPAMAVPVGGAGATTLGAMGRMGASAAIPAALEYGTAEERAKKAAAAATGAAVGGVVIPKAVGTAVGGAKSALKGLAGNITPEAMALAEKARQYGIPVNAAQLGDSKFLKTLASSLEQMPFTGGAEAASKQREAFTRAVSKTFGEDTGKVTPEVYAAAKQRLGNRFNDLANRNTLNVSDTVKSKLNSIIDDAEATASDDTIRAIKNIRARLTEQARTTGGKIPAQVSNIVDDAGNPIIKAAASETPAVTTIPGSTYMSIDTELSNIIKAGGEKGAYAKRLQNVVRSAMDDSISAVDKAAWQETRTQYKNMKAVRNVVARDMGSGDVPPTQLMNALNSTEAGKEAMAMGTRGSLGELGQIGRQFVRDTVPNSGTAQRAIAMGLIGGGGYAFGAEPATIAGMLAGGATVGRLINKALQSPQVIKALSDRGISMSDLAKIPPDRLVQILGGLGGITTADYTMEEE